MITDFLVFMRNHLNEQLHIRMGGDPNAPVGDKVVFVDGSLMDPINFKIGAVTELLLNVEEERVLRAPDLYSKRSKDGNIQRAQPDIRLILYVLFVARFKQYEVAWDHLSHVLGYLQSNRVFDSQTNPGLGPNIDKLIFELFTLNFAQQNEVWNALRTTHHPSLLYRVQLLHFFDAEATEKVGVSGVETRVKKIP